MSEPRDAAGRFVSYEPDVAGRFWSKVERRPGCWGWLGNHNRHGYGVFTVRRYKGHAHRFAYRLTFGEPPSGYVIDHLCRDRSCVNPAHLEAVTSRENTMRGVGPAAREATTMTCPRGHRYEGANLSVRGNKRYCRECALITQRERRARARRGA